MYPDTLDEAISLGLKYYGAYSSSSNPAFNDEETNRKLANILYREIVRKGLCGTQQTQSINTVSGTREYANEDDYSSTSLVYYTDNFGADNILGVIYENKITPDSGPPQNYYLKNGYIGFDPKPDAIYPVTRKYFPKPTTELAGDSELELIPSDFREVLSFGMAMKFFSMDPGDMTGGEVKYKMKYDQMILDIKDYIQNGQNQQEFGAVG